MTPTCGVCLKELRSESDDRGYHPRCLRELFGVSRVPTLDIELARLHTAGLAMVGHTSLSGVQRKVSVKLSFDRATLQVAVEGGRYLLKPQTQVYPALPENEHATTRLAGLVGIGTPPSGLVPLKDDTPAFIISRFDRLPDGAKLRQEDFCQLAEKSPKDKYDGSSELCVRIVREYASEPLVEILKLYRALVFAWWTGNGDMHLKNFSLVASVDGRHRLSPAYDQVSTRLVINDDQLALSVCGKKDNLKRDTWLEFARYCEIPPRAAERVLAEHVAALDQALSLIERSCLPAELKDQYKELLRQRAEILRDR